LEHVEDLLAAYHDGELSLRARKRVEAHLRKCPHCRGELCHMQALSRTLSAYPVPDLDQGAQQFRAQVMLRLARRRRVGSAPSGWWYLVPLALNGAMVGLLALFALPSVLRVAWVLLEWLGVDPAVVLELRVGIQLSAGALALLRDMGTLAWEIALYAALLLLFGSYVGWVGVLWRTATQRRFGKER
jgi:predicted anti-sigma-YlaC factor YlaD